MDPVSLVEDAMLAAENSLREGETQAAESRYRSALMEGWLLMGAIATVEGRLAAARDAFLTASLSAVDNRRALHALAAAHLRMGEPAQAAEVLRSLAGRDVGDLETRRMLAQALIADGQAPQAVRELEEALRREPADPELVFALGRAYLHLDDVDRAAGLLAGVVEARPIPQTHVLLGRTYLDFAQYDRARAELRAALKKDPQARRAHYYLGLAAARGRGRAGLEEAIAEFRAELEGSPEDVLANLELGVALVESQRPEEAASALEVAGRSQPVSSRTLYYLGRARLGAGRPADAAAALQGAMELAQAHGANAAAFRAIHVQLGQASRQLGRAQESARHFAEAERLSSEGAAAEREQLARYMADDTQAERAVDAVTPMIEPVVLAAVTPAERQQVRTRVTAALARAYLNLGVMHAQAERFAEAAEMLEKAAEVDPDFPQVQTSLGIAYFNARQFEKAIGPLTRAHGAHPRDAGLERMLGMACLNAGRYERAAELLAGDPELGSNPSLQFAYGLALVKSERAAEAERVFSGLLARHGDSPELSVLLGQAHAQQGDFDAAVQALRRAIAVKPGVAEAQATLGVIHLRRGELAEAEVALRAALEADSSDVQSQQHLAIVLDSLQRPDEAIPLLRALLQAKPDIANARYLLGKILLGQGAAQEAVEHLEAASRLTPEEANVRYQLGQAYQRLGRAELAQEQFEVFRRLKSKR